MVKKTDFKEIQDFLKTIPAGELSFRYYNNRGPEVLENHILTLILKKDDRPIAYGHLDRENKKNWLGIAVGDKFKGQGFGKKMMTELIKNAKKFELKEIYLSVDSENLAALFLYKKFRFKNVSKKNGINYMKLNLI